MKKSYQLLKPLKIWFRLKTQLTISHEKLRSKIYKWQQQQEQETGV